MIINNRARRAAGIASRVSAAALVAMSLTQPAFAQSGASEDVGGLQDIVVTARRVEERSQDVPLTIAAMDADMLRDNKISQVSQLGGMIPNVNVNRNGNPGGSSITIRGVPGQGLPRIGLDNRVGVYLDGIYLARTIGQSFELADIERMEVLKGPQGTLFGRNVTAGSINMVTAAPSGKFGVIAEGGIGTIGRRRARLTVNLPEWNGFSARFTYSRNQQDGDIKNLAAGYRPGPITVSVPASTIPTTLRPDNSPYPTGGTPFNLTYNPRPAADSFGMSKADSYFAAIRYEGIENLTIDYKYDRSDTQETNAVQNLQGFNPDPVFGLGCVPSSIMLGGNVDLCGSGSLGVAAFGAGTLTPNFGYGVGVISAPPTGVVNYGGNAGSFEFTGPQPYQAFSLGFRRPKAKAEYFTPPALIHAQGHSLTLNYEASDDLLLRSITGYRRLRTEYAMSNDGGNFALLNNFLTWVDPVRYPTSLYPAGGSTPYPIGAAFQEQRQSQWSQEFQVIGKAAPWMDFLVGAYYFREKGFASQFSVLNNAGSLNNLLRSVRGVSPGFVWPPQVGIPPLAPNGGTNQWGIGSLLAGDWTNVTSSSQAMFGRVTVRPVEKLEVVLGGRYTRDQKTSDGLPFLMGILPDADPFQSGFQARANFLKQTFRRFTWDGTATYSVSDDVNLYARYATAFLSGGQVRNAPFNPETTRSAEIGIKSEFFDRRLRFNAAAFWQKSKDFQFTNTASVLTAYGFVTATGLANLGSQTTKGFEVEVSAMPVRGLTLNGNLGYTKQIFNQVNTGGQPVPPPSFPSAPAWTATTAAQYDTPALFGDAYLSLRIDANYRSKYGGASFIPTSGFLPQELLNLYGFTTVAQYAAFYNANVQVGDVWLVNGRISLSDIAVGGSKARISGYVMNIFDADKAVYNATFGFSSGANYVRAREFGLDLRFEF